MSEIPEFLDQDPSFDDDSMGVDPMPWHQVWITAITKPNEQTFKDLAAQPNAKPGTAYLWVFLSYLIIFSIIAVAQVVFGLPSPTDQLGLGSAPVADAGMGVLFIVVLCMGPLLSGFVVLTFMFRTALVQWVAKLFGGTGSYDKLVYPFAAIYAPFLFVSGILGMLSAIPLVGFCFGIFAIGAWVYKIVLQILAVKAVNDFDTGKAVGSVLLPGLAIFIFFCCCFAILMGGLAASGPIIGDIFSEINQSIY